MSMSFRRMNRWSSVVVAIMTYVIAAIVVAVCFVKRAQAKEIYFDSGLQQVRIKPGGPTIFRFPKAVQTITGAGRFQIEPANKSDPSYQVLAVVPRFSSGGNDVNFLLGDGTVIKTKIIVSANFDGADGICDFKATGSEGPQRESASQALSEVDLLKAMIRDDEVNGYKVSHTSDGIGVSESAAEVVLIRIYKGNPFNGFVFRVTNTSCRKNLEVDIRKFTVGEPNLAIISQSDESLLLPKGKGINATLVRIVAKNTAGSRDFILPIEGIDPKQEKK